jgi:hypothetical protein
MSRHRQEFTAEVYSIPARVNFAMADYMVDIKTIKKAHERASLEEKGMLGGAKGRPN